MALGQDGGARRDSSANLVGAGRRHVIPDGPLADLHCNGFAGVDFNDAAITADALDHALHVMLRTGVTQVLPTLITADEDVLHARLRALDAAAARARLGAMVAGWHLEGPFLNPGAAGCHPRAAMRDPDAALLDRLCASLRVPVRMLTLAPELPGADALITHAVRRGVIVALGHTLATVDAVRMAAALGATLSTHLGNALPGPVHKFDNALMAQLAEMALTATLIADSAHVPPHVLRVIAAAKRGRVALVTDATAAAAAPPGPYTLAGMPIRRDAQGEVWGPDGTRAGSALTLDQAVRNCVAWGMPDATGWADGAAAGLSPRGTVIWAGGYVRSATAAEVTVTNAPA